MKTENTADWYISDYVERCKKLASHAVSAAENFEKKEIGNLQFAYTNYKGTRLNNPEVKTDIPLYAFSMGDVAFVTAPYEMFSENGQAIKENSPFDTTFVATCSNGNVGYIPSSYAFEYDCYEVSITRFVRGTAETLIEEHGKLLQQIYDQQK